MSDYALAWVWAFAFTQLIEIPIYRKLLGCGTLRAFGASALTHPLLWYAFQYVSGYYIVAVALAELFAWLTEALYFARPYGARRALVASLIANATSFALGVLSQALFDFAYA